MLRPASFFALAALMVEASGFSSAAFVVSSTASWARTEMAVKTKAETQATNKKRLSNIGRVWSEEQAIQRRRLVQEQARVLRQPGIQPINDIRQYTSYKLDRCCL